jgi:tetratricopeptide (TPR) repeat protein
MRKKTSPPKKLTRKEKRELDIEIGFLEGVVRRDPAYVDALRVLADDYTRRGRLTEGLKLDESLAKLTPGDAVAHYNLACSYSMTDRIDLAVLAMEQALVLGYSDFKWLAEDPDLENLRLDPAYRKILAKFKISQIEVA